MAKTQSSRDDLNAIARDIVDAAFRIHSDLGPGLLESVYEILLQRELIRRGHSVRRQVRVTFRYDGVVFKNGFRVDLIVDDKVLVEVKAKKMMKYVYERQLLTYLKLMDFRLGLLINFGDAMIKNGVKRVVHNF